MARWIAVALTIAVVSADDNWPQFRGPKSGVAADDPVLPDTWSPTENVVWKIDVAGRGWSSPVVWGDHVFVTAAVNTAGADESLKPVPSYTARSFGGPMSGRDIGTSSDPHRWVVYDVDFKTGKIRWERSVRTGVPTEPKHQKDRNSGRKQDEKKREETCHVVRLIDAWQLMAARTPREPGAP